MTAIGQTPSAGGDRDRVVVGVDGSEGSRSGLLWAADEALLRGAPLLVVHGGSVPDGPAEQARSLRPPGTTVVAEAVRLVTSRHPDLEVRGEADTRAAGPALVARSAGADLLVVGARGRGGFTGLLLGSVSQSCLQHARCPVVVVRPGTTDGGASSGARRIVVGIDGSDGSELALGWALEEAARRSAPVEAVHAWQFPPVGGFVAGPPEGFAERARRLVDGAVAEARSAQPTVAFTGQAVVGAPVPTLLQASGGAALLVVGWRGHVGFHDALVGSVAMQCAHHARIPVVVVRPTTGREPVGPS